MSASLNCPSVPSSLNCNLNPDFSSLVFCQSAKVEGRSICVASNRSTVPKRSVISPHSPVETPRRRWWESSSTATRTCSSIFQYGSIRRSAIAPPRPRTLMSTSAPSALNSRSFSAAHVKSRALSYAVVCRSTRARRWPSKVALEVEFASVFVVVRFLGPLLSPREGASSVQDLLKYRRRRE